MKVDIIVPIYNAYEYTVECIDTILKYTDMTTHRLILINDKSTDKRLDEYLIDLGQKKYDNIVILENSENIGFVRTVNIGMNYSSENDIVLLNSDTEVTPNWLKKIQEAAYLNKYIATVTPLTNNGTICSVPKFCEDNEIPNNLDVYAYSKIIERTSLKMYPQIPTAVGFCMYIKRSVINEIGLFDYETFGKGYGEENDFCCRALEKGYHHILCDDTFIFHKGSMSFKDEKQELINQNLNKLNNRYPYYSKMVQEFIVKNYLKRIQDNINFQIKMRNGKKNIMYVLHNDFVIGRNHPIGGTEYHVKDLVENIHEYNTFVMFIHNNKLIIQLFINGGMKEFSFDLNETIYKFTFSTKSYSDLLEKILVYFDINIVHVHHFIGQTFDIVYVAERLEIPIYLTIHDYYLICPTINLLNNKGEYCLDCRNQKTCSKCMRNKLDLKEVFIDVWNEQIYNILPKFKEIFTPSHSSKDIFEDYYKNKFSKINFKINVKEHGIDKIRIGEKKKTENFNIAFVGGIAPYKGSKIIYDLIKNNKNSSIVWHIFGNLGDQNLEVLETKNFIKHGRYDRNQITDLLLKNNIDLVCILSIWPETYSYTISESIQSQIPILSTDVGALKERIERYDCGWTIDYKSRYNHILEKIEEIVKNKEEYDKKVGNIKKIKFLTKEDVAKNYLQEYKFGEISKYNKDENFNRYILNNYSNDNINEFDNIQIKEKIYNLQLENKALVDKITMMEQTIGWKCLQQLRKYPKILNFFKNNILLKIYRVLKG